MMKTKRVKRGDQDQEEEHTNLPTLSPEIIMFEILPWVPLNFLFRFKLVCKEWRDLISSNTIFKLSQSQRCCLTNPQTFLYQKKIVDYDDAKLFFLSSSTTTNANANANANGGDGVPDRFLTYISRHRCMSLCRRYRHLEVSTNGLLLGTYVGRFYLTNPITKSWLYINKPENKVLLYPGLAVEPVNSNPYYMIVCPYRDYDRDPPPPPAAAEVGFLVYSSRGAGDWITSDAKVCLPTTANFSIRCKTVFTGGRLYWTMSDGRVMWFDVEDSSAGIVNNPSGKKFSAVEAGDYNGELTYSKITARNMEVWVLRRKKGTEFIWVKKHYLRLTEIFRNNSERLSRQKLPRTFDQVKPFSYQGGDVVLFWAKKGEQDGIIFSYNTVTQKLEPLRELRSWVSLHSYTASLVSLPS